MAKLTIVARPYRDDDGTVPLYLRISHRNHTRYVSLSLRVKEKYWNAEKHEVRRSHPNRDDIQSVLVETERKARKALLALRHEGLTFTADRIKRRVEEALAATDPGDFLSYAWEIARGYERRGQINSWYRFRAILNKLESYQKPIPFGDLTPTFLRRYMDHLSQKHKNNQNTISKNLSGIRTILYQAIREGYFSQDKNPFFHVTLSEKKAKKERLSREEITRLVGLDLKEGSSPWHSRNYFLFAMYMAGIRIGDVMQLRWEYVQNGRLKYEMDKTEGQKNLPITTPAAEILLRYEHRRVAHERIFPALDDYDLSTPKGIVDATKSKTAQVNGDLAEIQKAAKIHTKLSTHVARHSFADLARKAGWSIYDISKALDHSSIQQTQAYLASFDEDHLDERLNDLF